MNILIASYITDANLSERSAVDFLLVMNVPMDVMNGKPNPQTFITQIRAFMTMIADIAIGAV